MRRALLGTGATLLGLAGALLLPSCATILGIGDRELEDGGADGAAEAGATVLVTKLNEPDRLVVDSLGENLYWTEEGNTATNGGVFTYDIQAGKAHPLAQGLATPTELAIDSKDLYWINAGAGQIVKCEIASGCSATTILVKETEAFSLAVDAENLYWLTGDGTLHKASKATGTEATILATQTDGLEAPTNCFVDSTSGDILVGDPGFVDGGISSVWRISSKGKGGLTALQSPAGCPCRFTSDSTHEYWTSLDNGSVVGLGRTGSSKPETILMAQNSPQHLAYDPSTSELYLANLGSANPKNPDGTIVKFSPNGQTMTNLVANQQAPLDLVIAGSFVYFITLGQIASVSSTGSVTTKPSTGTLVRVHK
jgi:DNA-binding beta-propeller fold protein YncE